MKSRLLWVLVQVKLLRKERTGTSNQAERQERRLRKEQRSMEKVVKQLEAVSGGGGDAS